MKLLNLSSLNVNTDRCIKIGEIRHEVKPLKVSDFMRITEVAQQIDAISKKGEFTALKELELTIDLISCALPSVTREELGQLDISELHAIADFIKGIDVDGVINEQTVDETVDDETEGK